MKKIFLLIAAIIVVLIIPLLLSQPSFNGSAPGCSGSGCHTLTDGIVSVTALDNLQVEITLSGTSSKVAGELVDQNGNVVTFVNSTNSNPFILTAPSAGTYRVNAGYKNPARRWDSSMVSVTDLLPPAAPSNLTASVNQNPLSVELNWMDNSTVEDGFVIEKETVVADVYEIVDTVSQNVTMYVDTNVAYFTYNYRVKAYNVAGDSPYSNVAQVLVPVELTSFTADVKENGVLIEWTTATEKNNMGFEIQRKTEDTWKTLDFIKGKGTTTDITNYSFLDSFIEVSFSGSVEYRLKQIDFDGTFEYSETVTVDVDFTPDEFVLYQNYPNPFNPSTSIQYKISSRQFVTVKVFDVLGNEVATLVNEEKPAGDYKVEFNATDLPSGIYLYKIIAGSFTATKKMTLVK
ncbi:hypothetical protein BMS3Abin03_00537 [bacterium BMS3Abin03]|nr:hypothetical protein BMS3Abin03_00537 [bacterium BMS3Abin03]